jgi:xanthine dehydrogenase YagR molybdenum-binding subunit
MGSADAVGVTAGSRAANAGADGEPEPLPARRHGYDVSCTIDGYRRQAHVALNETALELLRDRFGDTGPKYACGVGACGACAILVNGDAVNACVLPAVALDGAVVATARSERPEFESARASLCVRGAIQCGYCTPGFVVEMAGLLARGGGQSRSVIAETLSGHLCRCGSYPAVLAAATALCRTPARSSGEARRAVAWDLAAKASGRAPFTADIRRPGMLEGGFVRSGKAHARILDIDVSGLAALGEPHAVHLLLRPGDTIRYVGQEIVAVAAERTQLRSALKCVRVTYEELPAATDPVAARRLPTPLVWTGSDEGVPVTGEWPLRKGRWVGNVRGPVRTSVRQTGAADRLQEGRAGEQSEVVDGAFATARQSHAPLEPRACVAEWSAGELTVWATTQGTARLRRRLATHFGLAVAAVRVKAEYVGGAFGAKGGLGVETVAAGELARQVKRPVRFVLDRRDEFITGGYRPSTTTDLVLATAEGGHEPALRVSSCSCGGTAIGAITAGVLASVYGRVPCTLDDCEIVAHLPPARAFRAPGGPAAFWALEQAIDTLALRLRRDPIALRLEWDTHAPRRRLYASLQQHPLWRNRSQGRATGRYRRGVGLAAGAWFTAFDPSTEVEVEVAPSGGLIVRCAAQDVGQGVREIVAGAVAECFGLSPTKVTVELGDSVYFHGPGAKASSTAASVVPAAVAAALGLRDRIRSAMSATHTRAPVDAAGDGLRFAGGVSGWAVVLPLAIGQSFRARRPLSDSEKQLRRRPDGLVEDSVRTSAVCIAEVEVDLRLGGLRPTWLHLGIACGRILSRAGADSQVRGAALQAMGQALFEEHVFDTKGRLVTGSFIDYRLPALGDTPEITIEFDEEGFEHLSGGAAGLGEVAAIPVPAAIGNAVADATGWRASRLPIRATDVLAGVADGWSR